LAKTPRGWTGARTPSAIKRVRQAQRRRAINQPRRSTAKTYVATAIQVASGTMEGDTAQALANAMSALDKAAKVGAIHPNAAARRKSRLTLKINALEGGVAIQTAARAIKTTGTAAAVKAARTRIASAKATKAKGPQTAAGKARAALSKSARSDAAPASAATTPVEAPKTKVSARPGAKAPAKAAAKTANKPTPKAPAKAAAKTADKPAAKAAAKTEAKAAKPAKAAAKTADKPAAKAATKTEAKAAKPEKAAAKKPKG
jgi:ribosomal protein S20